MRKQGIHVGRRASERSFVEATKQLAEPDAASAFLRAAATSAEVAPRVVEKKKKQKPLPSERRPPKLPGRAVRASLNAPRLASTVSICSLPSTPSSTTRTTCSVFLPQQPVAVTPQRPSSVLQPVTPPPTAGASEAVPEPGPVLRLPPPLATRPQAARATAAVKAVAAEGRCGRSGSGEVHVQDAPRRRPPVPLLDLSRSLGPALATAVAARRASEGDEASWETRSGSAATPVAAEARVEASRGAQGATAPVGAGLRGEPAADEARQGGDCVSLDHGCTHSGSWSDLVTGTGGIVGGAGPSRFEGLMRHELAVAASGRPPQLVAHEEGAGPAAAQGLREQPPKVAAAAAPAVRWPPPSPRPPLRRALRFRVEAPEEARARLRRRIALRSARLR